MKINLSDIKTINLCYENCEVDTIYNNNLLGIYIPRKFKSSYSYNNKTTYTIKTFEIALKDLNNFFKDTDFSLRTDLAQLTINYTNGQFDHFYISWDKNDNSCGSSSLQKIHKKGNLMSITSNCDSSFIKST